MLKPAETWERTLDRCSNQLLLYNLARVFHFRHATGTSLPAYMKKQRLQHSNLSMYYHCQEGKKTPHDPNNAVPWLDAVEWCFRSLTCCTKCQKHCRKCRTFKPCPFRIKNLFYFLGSGRYSSAVEERLDIHRELLNFKFPPNSG